MLWLLYSLPCPPSCHVCSDQDAGDFGQLSRRVGNNVFVINSNVQTLQRLAQQLGTAKDTHDFRHSLQELVEKTRVVSRDTGALLKALNALPLPAAGDDHDTRRIHIRKVSADFSAALHGFEAVQKTIAAKCKQFAARERQSLSAAVTEKQHAEAEAEASSAGETSALLGRGLNKQRLEVLDHEIEYNAAIIAEREEAIKQVEATILEVNEMFRDLGAMVHDQGTLLDNIEANVVSVGNYVGQGVADVDKAAVYQRRARGKACCILFILAVVLAILLLMVFLARKR
jgi:t-SNARE complex subunit (syntaxin)